MNAHAAKIIFDEKDMLPPQGVSSTPSSTIEAIDKKRTKRRIEKSSAAFRTIGEAADELGLKTHVLRFWESKFSQISPMKRRDRRRFYRPEDMRMLRAIQILLHEQGMTIKGAQRYLAHNKIDALLADEKNQVTQTPAGKSVRDLQDAVRVAVEGGAFRTVDEDENSREKLGKLLDDLTGLKSRLDQVRNAS